MKSAAILSRKDRDINTPKQFIRAVGISSIVHALLVLGVVLAAQWSYKPNIIVPGYRVNLVAPDLKPSSLLDTPEPKKKKAPELKKKKYREIKKKPTKTVKKKLSKAKKIVPKKKRPKKKTPKKKVAKEAREPAPSKIKQPDTGPRKTIVTEGEVFPHIWYLKIVERKVKQNWLTHGIEISGKTGDPVVKFRIAKSGSVTNVDLEKSSGSQELDKSALNAVMEAQPFPPLPEDFIGDSLGVHFGFSYEQRNH